MIERLPDEVRTLLRPETVPDWRAPMLATLTDKRFSDPRWIFELKFDGQRCLAFRDGDRIQLLSRNRQHLNGTYPELVDEQRSVSGDDDDHPPAAGRAATALVWPAWEPQSLTTQRSFIDAMASRNEPYRPDW